MTTKQYIQYEQYLNRRNHLIKNRGEGVIYLVKKNKFKMALGIGCLIVAIIPNGLGVIAYPLSLWLLGISTSDLRQGLNKRYRLIKYKLRARK